MRKHVVAGLIVVVIICLVSVSFTLVVSPAAAQSGSQTLTALKTNVKVGESVIFVLTFPDCAKKTGTQPATASSRCQFTLSSQDGSFQQTQLTDANGQATFSYPAPTAGTFTFQASGSYWSSNNEPVPLIAFQSNAVTVTVTQAGGSGSGDGSGSGSGSDSGSGSSDGGGAILSGDSAVTNATGVKATVSGANGAAWFWLLTLIIVILLAAIIVVLLVTRRRPRYRDDVSRYGEDTRDEQDYRGRRRRRRY
jgi:hypothetical protein